MGKVRSSCPEARSSPNAQVVELVDTLASGASARKGVEVQVLSWAPEKHILQSYIVSFTSINAPFPVINSLELSAAILPYP